MVRNRILLLFITCFFSTALGFAGSTLGSQFSWNYSWVGYFLGGVLGVAVAAWFAVRWSLIRPTSYLTVLVGGMAGLECGLAALYEIRSFPWPVIPMLSLAAPGLGAAIGHTIEELKEKGKSVPSRGA